MLEWERGRQLKQFGSTSFTYDAGGVRQSKTANGVTTSYFTEGNRIHKEERSDGKTLIYAYDESGIASITYNGTLYYVQKNFQGDIVALVDQSGNVVAKYVYDAWGVCNVYDASGTLNTSDSFIGNINPFRYRGYYYDAETGLYYLQTRYYEPRAGRFLSPDSVDYIAPDLIGGLNLYAYCNNNPVMYIDLNGYVAISATIGLFALFGLLAVGTIEAIYHPVGDFLTWGYESFSEAFPNDSGNHSDNILEEPQPITQVENPSINQNEQSETFIIDGEIGIFLAEHKNNARPSTKNRHQKGQTQRKREKFGGEKGDKRRPYHKWKRNANFFIINFLKINKLFRINL